MTTPDAAPKRSRMPVGTIAAVAIGLVAVGAFAWAATHRTVEAPPCVPTGLHEHASFSVFVRNQTVSWLDPAFDFPRTGKLAGHLHIPQAHTLHVEGDCTTVGRFFREALLTALTEDTLALDALVHDGETYRDGEGGRLRFFLGEPPAGWTHGMPYFPASEASWREVDRLDDRQPRDGEYYLVTFGDEGDDAIRAQQLSIPIQKATE